MTFSYKEPLFFFIKFVQKIIVSCFSDSFVRKRTEQSDGSCLLQKITSWYSKYPKNSLFFCRRIRKNFVSKVYCIHRHDDKMCFVRNCRYHIILLRDIENLLQNLDVFRFNYQHVDCLYTLFKYRFSSKLLPRVDISLILCCGQIILITKT